MLGRILTKAMPEVRIPNEAVRVLRMRSGTFPVWVTFAMLPDVGIDDEQRRK